MSAYTIDRNILATLESNNELESLMKKCWELRLMLHDGWTPPKDGGGKWWIFVNEEELFDDYDIEIPENYTFASPIQDVEDLWMPPSQDKTLAVFENIPSRSFPKNLRVTFYDGFDRETKDPCAYIFVSTHTDPKSGIIIEFASYPFDPETTEFPGDATPYLREPKIIS